MQKRQFIITYKVSKKPTKESDSLIGNAIIEEGISSKMSGVVIAVATMRFIMKFEISDFYSCF